MFWNRNQPRRILLVRNDGIGDLVLTLPALAAVRRQFPQAHVAALLHDSAAGLMAGSRYLDEIVVDTPSDSAARLADRLRVQNYDAAIMFHTNTRNCLAVWKARIPVRVTWGYKPVGFLLGNRRIALHRSHPPIHETEFALAFARRLGVEAERTDYSPQLELDAALRERVAARIVRELPGGGPLFGVHPGNKHSAYNWPQPHYVDLIKQLAQSGRVMVTGGPTERSLLERIRYRLGDVARGRVAFFWDLSLPELAAACERQTALTVSSTGPMHVARLMGTPLVALFSPHPIHSPRKWAPMGTGHAILIAPLEPGESPNVTWERSAEVMSRIPVQQAVEANLKFAAAAALRDGRSGSSFSEHAA